MDYLAFILIGGVFYFYRLEIWWLKNARYVCNVSYQYAINPYSSSPIFQINKHIGFDAEDGMGIDGGVFAKELFEIDSFNPSLITIYVNSLGGTVQDAFDIFEAIRACKARVKAIIIGFAYSSAGWCILSADEIEIKDYASWMCHLPYDPDDKDNSTPFLETVANSIKTILIDSSGKSGKVKKTADEISAMMKIKTYCSGHEMYEAGLCDSVVNSKDYTLRSISVKNHEKVTDTYKEYQGILNKFIETFNTKTMAYPKVVNRLKLAENSSEDDMLTAIAGIENQVRVANRERDDLSEKLKVVNASQEENLQRMKSLESKNSEIEKEVSLKDSENVKLQNRITELEESNGKLAAEKLEAQNKAKEDDLAVRRVRATDLVNGYAEAGKIKNEEKIIARWIEKAVENYDDVELQFESIQTNVIVPKVTNKESIKTLSEKEKIPGTPEYFRALNRERQAKENQGK